MTHLRTTIRDAVTTTVTNLTTTGTRVYKSRNLPLSAAEFPCLCVYARADVPEYADAVFTGGKVWPVRNLEMHVQGYVKDSDTSVIHTTLELIAEQVETAIFTTIPTGAYGVTLGEQTIQIEDSGDETLGTIDMVFTIIYRAAEGAPGVSI